MNVNFTGFKNAGVQKIGISNNNGLKAELRIFNCELTDDFNGKDLTLFKDTVFRIAVNDINHNFLNINWLRYKQNPNDYDIKNAYKINDKEIEIKNDIETLKLFRIIANLLTKISTSANEYFKVNKSYTENDDFYDSYMMARYFSKKDIDFMHSANEVKKTASDIVDAIVNDVDNILS